MTTIDDALAAEAGGEHVHPDQECANRTGMTKIALDSTWWGNKTLGEWVEEWWVKIDGETEKAWHVKEAVEAREVRTNAPLTTQVDEWLPKSVTELQVEPQWTSVEAEGEQKGTLKVSVGKPTKYGRKRDVSGDTYDAFKQDELDEKLDWDETHAAWNGNCWQIDADDDAVEALVEEATKAGYEVQLLP